MAGNQLSDMSVIPKQVSHAPKQPVFDTKVDLVVFSLKDPLNYSVTPQPVSLSDDGLLINDQKPVASSSSDEDPDYFVKPKL